MLYTIVFKLSRSHNLVKDGGVPPRFRSRGNVKQQSVTSINFLCCSQNQSASENENTFQNSKTIQYLSLPMIFIHAPELS